MVEDVFRCEVTDVLSSGSGHFRAGTTEWSASSRQLHTVPQPNLGLFGDHGVDLPPCETRTKLYSGLLPQPVSVRL